MVRIDGITQGIKRIVTGKLPEKNIGGKMSEQLINIEELAKYIQDNIKNILQKMSGEEVMLPKVAHEQIEEMAIKIRKENDIKTLLLSLKGKQDPSGISIKLSRGTNDEIFADISKEDFAERFNGYIKNIESHFTYGNRGEDWW